MSPQALLKQRHRPIDLQRPVVDGRQVYQEMCACGRKAVAGSRKATQQDQKAHRREAIVVSTRGSATLTIMGA